MAEARRRGDPTVAVAVLLLVAAVILGVAAVRRQSSIDHRGGPTERSISSTIASSTVPPAIAVAPATIPSEPRRPPVRVEIPSIGVDATVVNLGLHPDGTLETPTDFAQAGWWSGGYAPGQRGPAVIAGHVDSKAGPAVFFHLGDVPVGANVRLTAADGSEVTFRIDRVERHPKRQFPTRAVYGRTAGPELRLITCGGDFDASSGHYVDNVVVFASRVR